MAIKIVTSIGTFYNVNIKEEYSSVLFGFEDKETLCKIKEIDKNLDTLKSTEVFMYDGFMEKQYSHKRYYLYASSRIKPVIVNRNLEKYEQDIKDGMKGRLSAFFVKKDGKIICELANIQVIE